MKVKKAVLTRDLKPRHIAFHIDIPV